MDSIDKIKTYQQAILTFLGEYAPNTYSNNPSGIEAQIIADKEKHHYQLLRLGWAHDRFHHSCRFHMDIKGGKVWVQVNNTEEMIGDELVKKGIPAKDIILAFHPERVRKHTGFGIK